MEEISLDTELLKKYLAKGEDWEKLCERVSSIMAYEDERQEVAVTLCELEWLPNSPMLINAGIPGGRNLAACHLLHVPNSIEGIFETVKQVATITKNGGGIGLEFSSLSPKGSPLKYAPGGTASGPVSFMKVFNTTAEVVMEGGLRRAAMLGSLNANHPDALEFINAKTVDGILINFNISVTLDEGPQFVDKDVWNAIVKNAWLNGEPGLLFLDNINRDNTEFERIIGANACAELPMTDKNSCILASINLPNVIKDDWDYTILKQTVRLMVQFLNRAIDVNHYPLQNIAQSTRRTRNIGIGVMGFADLLRREQIPYTSDDALCIANELARHIYCAADDESARLAEVHGSYNGKPGGRRNYTLMAIAPTGHISRLAGVSSSIYPDYVIGLKMLVDQHLDMVKAWQDVVDNSISYTICFPHDKPISYVDQIFRGAYERGLKTMSVYRDGSRAGQPLKVEEFESVCHLDGSCT